MANFQAIQVKQSQNYPGPINAVQSAVSVGDFVIPAGLAVNDVIEMGCLPADCYPIDFIIDVPDIDTNGSPTVTLDVGIMSGRYGDGVSARTCGNEFVAASTVGQTGGVIRKTKAAVIAPTRAPRSWGIKLAAGAATLATGGTIRGVMIFGPRAPAMV